MHLPVIFKIATIILSILLIILVLIQERGTGLGGAFGGGGAIYRTRRGAERFIFRLTIILALLYVISAILGIVLH